MVLVFHFHLLVAAYRGVFRTSSNIYEGAFFAQILNAFKLLIIFENKAPLQTFDLVVGVLLRFWSIELTLVPSCKLSQENTQPENMCEIVFEKTKSRGGIANRMSVYAEAAIQKVL